jgi:hypothetical protein
MGKNPEHFIPNNPIHLDDGMFSDPKNLHAFLRNLYLGPDATYNLEFKVNRLVDINKIFDHIIVRHGSRTVSFKYRLL